MKILIINGSDAKGGAGKVCRVLAAGLRDRHHEVTFLVGGKSGEDPCVREIPRAQAATGKWRRKVIHRLGIDHCHLDSSFPRNLGSGFLEQFDLIHLHDAPSLNISALPWLTRIRPVLWTMHTMGAFTGNCIYAYDCERWKRACGRCPQFGVWPLKWLHRDASRANLHIKRLAHRRSRLHIVGVSEWISARAREGITGRHPVTTIQNPVDTAAFTPIAKSEARQQLGIAPDRKTILFAISSNPEDTRKGTDIIAAALPLLTTNAITLLPLGIGEGAEILSELFAGHAFLPPRHLDNDTDLNLYYSAADVVWHPSRADTSSMVGLESMASGTPVIAARVGGVPEVIGDGIGGILIDQESPQQLARETDLLFANPEKLAALSASARTRTEQDFNIERFLDGHENLYHAILDNNASTTRSSD
jgi:glycosyltransferase involved in cell wall biosynthesis